MAEALVLTDQTYAGDVASYMITRNVVGADTIQKGAIYVEETIKKKRTIPRVEVSNLFQKRMATPTSSGNITVDGRVIQPQDLMLYLEFNPRDFEAHWYAAQLNPKLLDAQLPATAETFITMQVMKRVNEFFENHIWKGRTMYDIDNGALDPTTKGGVAGDANYFYFDGLIYKALSDANTIQVGSPVALTGGAAGNIITQFQAGYSLVPQANLYRYGPNGLRLFISYADQQKYENTLQLLTTFKNQDSTEKGINRYNGYDVVPLAGLPANTFFWAMGTPDISSNLWMGINSTEDNELQLARLQPNSELFFLKGLFKADVQIGFTDQLVMYTTMTA
ncbi:MAG: hypothetical protein KGO82_19160 [Bacteroidota bacterium]|nr:hypothetical protein [Bacteroidota bacterium]